ncbi:alpha/beta hydrolase [Paenibacillus sp. IB182496]|uniref:Alpha/beta hydrolase n=1 Tax=Paenibacillus sabuli TaxID=2772509 RepID=A0A927BXG0_9BACL|nr:alpha/beta hydrolase [Paenibacillus sabuli]MBD2848137.1 alpha/beta hydrolase [Paenibacillus sabuli]
MDLAFEVHGAGGTPVVLIHSPGVDSREWKYVAPLLADQMQVITYDARGMGRSPAPEEPTSLVEDLRALLDHLGLARVSLVGHSMGGQAATDFALTYPDRVARLALLAPSLTGFEPEPDFVRWMTEVNACAPDVERLVNKSLGGPNYRVVMNSGEREFLQEMHTAYMTRVFSQWKSFEVNWPQPPAIERLEQLRCETLFVHGTVEWPDMLRVAEQFERVPNVRFARIDEADHMLTLTHPGQLARLLVPFLDGTL